MLKNSHSNAKPEIYSFEI